MNASEVPAVLTAIRILWMTDHKVQRKSDAEEVQLCRLWHRHLAPFTVDEVHDALNSMVTTHPTHCPSLGAIVSETRSRQRPAAPVVRTNQNAAVHPSQLDSRPRLRAELVKYHRRSDGTVDPAKLAEIDEEVSWVGEREAAFLATQGITVEVTMPQRRGL